jgi:hypothetical protein
VLRVPGGDSRRVGGRAAGFAVGVRAARAEAVAGGRFVRGIRRGRCGRGFAVGGRSCGGRVEAGAVYTMPLIVSRDMYGGPSGPRAWTVRVCADPVLFAHNGWILMGDYK